MKVAFLNSSVSRKAGGIFDISRRLAQSLAIQHGAEVSVMGLEDEFTREDLKSWLPVLPRAHPVQGFRQFGYSPRISHELARLGADVAHTHCLWMYPALAGSRTRCRGSWPHSLA